MAGAKEIRTKIKSIQNTQKITKAMEMVAASKMRSSQDRMKKARPYATKIRKVIGHLAASSHEKFNHPYMQERKVERVGYIVISTDRGLCGGLNINLFKAAVNDMKEWHESGVNADLCIIGQKGGVFFRNMNCEISSLTTQMGDAPKLEQLIGIVKVMLDAFNEGTIDRLELVYNRFVNTMTQQPVVETLLPLQPLKEDTRDYAWDYIYEPDPVDVLEELLMRYVESLVYQAVVENNASEQGARMMAMKNASDNAGEIIGELQLAYNKARQAAITQEIAEIVGGAAAV